jgi:hypothetical protein
MNSLTLEWESNVAARMTTMLQYLDTVYPQRIAGVFPGFLHTSEWFMPGPHDAGSGPSTKLSDYSEGTRAR